MKNLFFKTSKVAAYFSGAMETRDHFTCASRSASKNGARSKSQRSRSNSFFVKKVFIIFVSIICYGICANAQNTVNLPENVQCRKDIIVMKARFSRYDALHQIKITHIDDTYIHIIKHNKKGKEKVYKILKNSVAFTLSFDETAKQELYPLQMNVDDFLRLPVYNYGGWFGFKGFVVFGTDGISNLAHLKEMHPDIYDDLVSGSHLFRTGAIFTLIGACGLIIFPLAPAIIPACILTVKSCNKLNRAFENYYNNCFDLEVCCYYGIDITPYNTSLHFKDSQERK